jgi:hypothetical protein
MLVVHSTTGDTMFKLRLFAVTAVAAGALSVGALVGTPAASAATKYSCAQAHALAATYYWCAEYLDSVGDYATALYWRGKADGTVDASC